MITTNDILFSYPLYNDEMGDTRIGGIPTSTPITDYEDLVDNEYQLFNLAVKYTDTYNQYRKVFIYNNSDYTMEVCSVYGYNKNSTGKVLMAIERGQDKDYVLDGIEAIKNSQNVPKLFYNYVYQEILKVDAVSIPDIPSRSGIGIWLKLSYDTIGSNFYEDEFILGFSCDNGVIEHSSSSISESQNSSSSSSLSSSSMSSSESDYTGELNKEISLIHSRIDASVNIVSVKESNNLLGNYLVEFEMIDTSTIGIDKYDAIYGVYTDKIFVKEVTGTNKVYVQLYNNDIPVFIEIYLLPYSGYRPDIGELSVGYQSRVELIFKADKPELQDIKRHLLYWDNATGTYISERVGTIECENRIGSGSEIDYFEYQTG
jgi:hypothetical protein